MARTYILLVWIGLLKANFIEAGIPLVSRSYSSWPSLRTYSKSIIPPFLTATPCLTIFPNFTIAPIIPSPDVDFVPKPVEKTEKTSVILHKVHRDSENEITLTLKLVKDDGAILEQDDDKLTKENLKCNKYLDENTSDDVSQDDLPKDEETMTENETVAEDIPIDHSSVNEDTLSENNTIKENRSTDDENEATEDNLTDKCE